MLWSSSVRFGRGLILSCFLHSHVFVSLLPLKKHSVAFHPLLHLVSTVLPHSISLSASLPSLLFEGSSRSPGEPRTFLFLQHQFVRLEHSTRAMTVHTSAVSPSATGAAASPPAAAAATRRRLSNRRLRPEGEGQSSVRRARLSAPPSHGYD